MNSARGRNWETASIREEFFDIEADTDLFELTVCGVPVWERVRFDVYREIEGELLAFGDAHDTIDFDTSSYARGVYLWLRNVIQRNPYLAGEHDVLFWGHPRRTLDDDGTWWDRYCDPLHEELDVNAVHVEQAYKNRHRTPSRTENLRYLDLIEYTGTLLRKSGLVDVTVPPSAETTLETAVQAFEERFGVTVDLTGTVEYALAQRQSTKGLYERFVDRIDPDVAILVVSYGKETFIEVCRDRDIPVVELQHGVIHPSHLGYAYPGCSTKEMFPDYLLTFGEFWNGVVDYPLSDDQLVPVGYPYLEGLVDRYGSATTDGQLAFISQGPIGEQLSKFAVDVHRHPDVHHDVVYKLHPGEYNRWRNAYPWLIDAKIEVVDDASRQLYQLFAESTAQIGVGSTAVYEGLCFDLETFVYDCPGSEVLHPLLEEGVARRVASADDLASSLGAGAGQFDRRRFFAPRPIEAIREFLRDVVGVDVVNGDTRRA